MVGRKSFLVLALLVGVAAAIIIRTKHQVLVKRAHALGYSQCEEIISSNCDSLGQFVLGNQEAVEKHMYGCQPLSRPEQR